MKTGKLIQCLMLAIVPMMFWQCSDSEGKDNEKQASTTDNVRSFNTIRVKPGKIERSLNITGRVIAMNKVEVTAQVQGIAIATSKTFKEGASYNRGEVLIAIENTDFSYNLAAQKSQFMNALVRIMTDLKLDYPDYFDKWNNYLSTLDVSRPVPQMPDVSNKQLQYFLVANNIFNLYYNLKSQEETLKDFTVHAPFNGAVTSAQVDPGDLIRPGVKLGEFIRTDVYELKTAVSASDLSYLTKGQLIDFFARGLNQKYTAIVDRFGKSIDPSTQAVTVYLKVKGKDLREGMYLEATVPTKSFSNAVEIPKDVLTRENQVYTIDNSVVRLKWVKPLEYRQNSVIVQGLSHGETVITDRILSPVLGTRATSK